MSGLHFNVNRGAGLNISNQKVNAKLELPQKTEEPDATTEAAWFYGHGDRAQNGDVRYNHKTGMWERLTIKDGRREWNQSSLRASDIDDNRGDYRGDTWRYIANL